MKVPDSHVLQGELDAKQRRTYYFAPDQLFRCKLNGEGAAKLERVSSDFKCLHCRYLCLLQSLHTENRNWLFQAYFRALLQDVSCSQSSCFSPLPLQGLETKLNSCYSTLILKPP